MGVEVGSGVGAGVGTGVEVVGVAVGDGVGAIAVEGTATGAVGSADVGTAREVGTVINVGGGGPMEVGVSVEKVEVSTVSTDEVSVVETLF